MPFSIRIGKHKPARRRFTTAHGSVHSDRIERWLGAAACEQLSRNMRGWYGTPIPVARVPGEVYVDKQGDFVGRLNSGQFASLADYLEDRARMERIAARVQFARATRQLGGFASADQARSWTGQQRIFVNKAVTGALAGVMVSSWNQGTYPPAGAAGAAAPGGTAHTSANTGALPFQNPTTGTAHYLGMELSTITGSNSASFCMLLYDRLFSVAKTMNSTATEAVTGVPTRYQSTVTGAADSAENNFLFPEVQTGLPATAHNWTVCRYTDQSGNAGASLPSITGVSSITASRLDFAMTQQWFAPLAAGDFGIQALTQMQCSALVASGAINFVIGHPIGWFTNDCNTSGQHTRNENIASAVNMARIFDNACLNIMGMPFTATAVTAVGQIIIGAR